MLGKLFKYEFKAMGRILIPLYIAALIMSFISSLFFNDGSIKINYDSMLQVVIVMIIFFIFGCVVAASVGLSYIIAFKRFKDSILGNEGYIINTLPVSKNKLIISRLITSTVYEILSVIVAMVSISIMILCSAEVNFSDLIEELRMAFTYFIEHNSYVISFLKYNVLFILSMLEFNMSVYAAISVGYSFNSRKLVKAVVVYILFYFVSQVINSIILGGIISPFTAAYANNGINVGQILSLTFIFEVVYLIIYWIITNYFISKKLNLE